jgi:hypothetical protein
VLNLKDTIDQVCRKATNFRPHTFSICSLQGGKHVINGNKIRITHIGPERYTIDVLDASNALLRNVDKDMGKTYATAGMISSLAFAKTQYGNVVDDHLFGIIYDIQDRNLFYSSNGTVTQKTVKSAACMECGLVLPLRNLTIDHQRPQTGGELEAILKTFRAFGLTTEGPQGAKGKMILAYVQASAQPSTQFPTQIQQIIQAIPTRLERGPLSGSSVTDRYTLNDEGTLLYSFAVEAGQLEELKSQCMHGLLNLKPLCGACNSSRQNPTKF